MTDINVQEFSDMKKDINDVKGDVRKILELLGGNPIDRNDTGHVGIVNDHEERIKKLESLKDRFIWTVVGMSIPSGFGVASIIGWIIDHVK